MKTIHERSLATKTHTFEGEKRRPDLHEGRHTVKKEKKVMRHYADREKEIDSEIEKRYRQHSTKKHHIHDLFDFDDPESDSDYDDADEDTGIYHDDDPKSHPAQPIKHQFDDDKYYKSRERYFPEQSYHSAGSKKYGVETV